ncbi:MAG: fibrobacter succinogenes major paralogous domain-containing protein [Saprospiraceae bacterium]|nr:fibrobacter succinogenes major paralogous domain-containing protein [Saprospiraceae bacterium]
MNWNILYPLFKFYQNTPSKSKRIKLKSIFYISCSVYSPILVIMLLLMTACNFNSETKEKVKTLKETQELFKRSIPVQDTDGKIYQTVTIGSQTWMAEDLKKTVIECDSSRQARFTNGLERGPEVKLYVHAPRYAWYNNNKELGFGVIYNFAVVKHCQLCPPGYQIPTKADWELLIEQAGGESVAAKVLTQRGSDGFEATLGGRIDSYGSGMAGNFGSWWSSDTTELREAYTMEIGYQGYILLVRQPIRVGSYVRCIKQ